VRRRLQGHVNKDDGFASLCTGLVAQPGLGPLYQTLVSKRFGPGYIDDLAFRVQLDICYQHNPELTTALIESGEGAQVILETCTDMPGSVFEELATDIGRCDEDARYSYYKALASHEQGRAAAQIQAVRDAGGNVPEQTFPLVRRQDKRTGEAGTFQCGFPGCPSKPFSTFANLKKHVATAQQEYGRTGTARPATHVGYTPDPKDFAAERAAMAGDPKRRKVWGTGSK
jgi:hypothetical protein